MPDHDDTAPGIDVRRVSLDVETRAPTGQTNAYVIGADPAVLIDPAIPDETLDTLCADLSLGHIAVTHHHQDHVGAVARYATRHDATVWARTGRAASFAAATGRTPDRVVGDGTSIETGQGAVRVRETPGHAPEHAAFRADGALIAGDLASPAGSVVVGAPEGDMRAYLTSLRRAIAWAPTRLYPGHGSPVDGAAAVRATLERTVAHRLERERRVVEAVRGGATAVPEICADAYAKDLTGLRDLAEATVRAHLEKLAVEGAVHWNGTRAMHRS